MASDPVKNFGVVTVNQGYGVSDTSIVLISSDGSKLPQPSTDGAFNLVWFNATDYPGISDDPNKEIVRVTARSTDTLTVTRAQESVSATTKNTAGKTYKMILTPTKAYMDDKMSKSGDTMTGSLGLPINTISTDTTLDNTYYTVLVNATSGNIVITLPTAVGISGRIYIVKKTDSSANTVTVDGNGSETIDGATTKVLSTQYTRTAIQSNGTSWWIVD